MAKVTIQRQKFATDYEAKDPADVVALNYRATALNDEVRGSMLNDFIAGNEGNDVIFGRGGNDTLHGGADKDYVNGGVGNDLIFGNVGSDILVGGPGNDTINGGPQFTSSEYDYDSAFVTADVGTYGVSVTKLGYGTFRVESIEGTDTLTNVEKLYVGNYDPFKADVDVNGVFIGNPGITVNAVFDLLNWEFPINQRVTLSKADVLDPGVEIIGALPPAPMWDIINAG